MRLTLSDQERAELVAAQRTSRPVRHWRRSQAVLLRGEDVPLATVAQTLGCTQASVCNWTRAWGERGAQGVAEGTHRGAERRLDAAAEQRREERVEDGNPQAHGYAARNWTAALVRTELAKQGWPASERTVRRTLHRLGYRAETAPIWARPTRSGRRSAKTPWQNQPRPWWRRAARGGWAMRRVRTRVREFPPLRSVWAKRGSQRVVVISGRTGRRVIHGAHGALNGGSGDFGSLIRERSRQDDGAAFVQTLGPVHPDVPRTPRLGQRSAPPSQAGGRGSRSRPHPHRLVTLPLARAHAV